MWANRKNWCRKGREKTDKREGYVPGGLITRSQGEDKWIEGYFAVFDQETELLPGSYEQIAAGAFRHSLTANDVRCLFNHDASWVLGRLQNGTLELREDEKGLWGRVKINPEDRQAQDLYARVGRGDISGCSFGFYPQEEDYVTDAAGSLHWTVRKADLTEVSICTFPAYPQTVIQARAQQVEEEKRQRMMTVKRKLVERLEERRC